MKMKVKMKIKNNIKKIIFIKIQNYTKLYKIMFEFYFFVSLIILPIKSRNV